MLVSFRLDDPRLEGRERFELSYVVLQTTPWPLGYLPVVESDGIEPPRTDFQSAALPTELGLHRSFDDLYRYLSQAIISASFRLDRYALTV